MGDLVIHVHQDGNVVGINWQPRIVWLTEVRDGLPEGEGAFLACSFWLVDNYVLQGRYAEARTLFDRLLAHCNDVGLLAEEFDPATGRMLGNFPQAYSHVGLINCALSLTRQTGPAEERAESKEPVSIGAR